MPSGQIDILSDDRSERPVLMTCRHSPRQTGGSWWRHTWIAGTRLGRAPSTALCDCPAAGETLLERGGFGAVQERDERFGRSPGPCRVRSGRYEGQPFGVDREAAAAAAAGHVGEGGWHGGNADFGAQACCQFDELVCSGRCGGRGGAGARLLSGSA